jgi:RES domain
MDIWSSCKDRVAPSVLSGELLRIVESQEQVATNALVDNLHEQEILEQLVEQTKPKLPNFTQALHYLLTTPFRYPPLPHGSRFGSRLESGLLYGSLSLTTLLHEAAYYRFVFWEGMSTPPPAGKLLTQHMIFAASYHSAQGLQLQHSPFDEYKKQLTDPADYHATQQLGSALRQSGIEAIEYCAARDPQHGINVALFTPRALPQQKPYNKYDCLCETRADTVSFYANGPTFYLQFSLTTFQVNNKLPLPSL